MMAVAYMRFLLPAAVAVTMPALAESEVRVTRAGAAPASAGAAEYFTGSVRVEDRFQGSAPARISGATVTFEPRARTAWHTHPLGQTLIVTAGRGLVQHWSGPVREIGPGDVVWIRPASSIGTAPRRPTACRISPSLKRWTAGRWSGWSTSPTSNTSGSRDYPTIDLESRRVILAATIPAVRTERGRP